MSQLANGRPPVKPPFGWKRVVVVMANHHHMEGLQCCECGMVYVGRATDKCFDPHDCQKTPRVERLDASKSAAG